MTPILTKTDRELVLPSLINTGLVTLENGKPQLSPAVKTSLEILD